MDQVLAGRGGWKQLKAGTVPCPKRNLVRALLVLRQPGVWLWGAAVNKRVRLASDLRRGRQLCDAAQRTAPVCRNQADEASEPSSSSSAHHSRS